MKECCLPGGGSKARPPDHQSDAHQTEPLRPAGIATLKCMEKARKMLEYLWNRICRIGMVKC